MDWYEKSYDFKLTAAMMIILIGIIIGCYIADGISWGSGYCSCGGKWQFVQAVGHRYSTNYIYECDKCGRTKEFLKKY